MSEGLGCIDNKRCRGMYRDARGFRDNKTKSGKGKQSIQS